MANKILIVDDDRATRDELAQLLTHEGYETLTASDVPTAMHILGASAPDLLITEIRLDTYNGLHIIAMAPTPIPAIVLTGIADPVIEADARRFGAEYLIKPVSPATLLAVIAGMLGPAKGRSGFTLHQALASCVPDDSGLRPRRQRSACPLGGCQRWRRPPAGRVRRRRRPAADVYTRVAHGGSQCARRCRVEAATGQHHVDLRRGPS